MILLILKKKKLVRLTFYVSLIYIKNIILKHNRLCNYYSTGMYYVFENIRKKEEDKVVIQYHNGVR